MSASYLHGHFHLPWRRDAGLDHPLRIEVLDPDLFAHAAVGQRLARHPYIQRAAACRYHHLIALAHDFRLLQMGQGNELVGDHWSDKFLTNGLVH